MKKAILVYNQNDYGPTLMHNEALEFIDRNKDNKFFLYYASPLPHLPLQAPEKWVNYYRKKIGKEKPKAQFILPQQDTKGYLCCYDFLFR